jgi:outer membrane protein assembly factor BamE (lipoprotein component of BamABCDE complex)
MTGKFRSAALAGRIAALLGATALAAGCSTINDHRGFIAEESLIGAIQPGIDNRQSVEGTLGRPSFTSQFGPPTWYYVSSFTKQAPFGRPEIYEHSVLAIRFDQAGNVIEAKRSGVDEVVRISPDGDETPTLGRERTFLQDLFGNIGQVGAAGAGAPGGPGQ